MKAVPQPVRVSDEAENGDQRESERRAVSSDESLHEKKTTGKLSILPRWYSAVNRWNGGNVCGRDDNYTPLHAARRSRGAVEGNFSQKSADNSGGFFDSGAVDVQMRHEPYLVAVDRHAQDAAPRERGEKLGRSEAGLLDVENDDVRLHARWVQPDAGQARDLLREKFGVVVIDVEALR